MTPEASTKTITLSPGVFAVVLLLTLLIGLVSGSIFGGHFLSRLAARSVAVRGQADLPERPWLGVTYIPITAAVARDRKLTATSGALVVAVTPGSPALKAGMRENDIVKAIDGRLLDDNTSMMDIIKDKKPGDRVQITLLRDGAEQAMEIVLEKYPAGPRSLDERGLVDRARRFIPGMGGK